MDRIKAYIEELQGSLKPFDEKIHCENVSVNAVVSHYIGLAESEGTAVDARLVFPEDTGSVPAIDLCIIMGNLLENAVLACRRMKQGGKYISVRSLAENGTLSIIVGKQLRRPLARRGRLLPSRKRRRRSPRRRRPFIH